MHLANVWWQEWILIAFFYHVSYVLKVNLTSAVARMSRSSFLKTGAISESEVKLLQWDPTPNHLVCKRALDHTAKLAKVTEYSTYFTQN